jgi:hypothetical protein
MTHQDGSIFSLPYNCFYAANYNFFQAPEIAGRSIYLYVYAAMMLLACVAFGVLYVRRKGVPPVRAVLVPVLMASWLAWVGVAAMQFGHQLWYMSTVHKNMGAMTDEEKYAHLFGPVFEMSKVMRAGLPFGTPARLVADPGAGRNIQADALPYFLYPHLDLLHRDRVTGLILFLGSSEQRLSELRGFRPLVMPGIEQDILWERMPDDH